MIKLYENQKWQFVSLSKVSNVKTLYDHGDLEKKVKITLMA